MGAHFELCDRGFEGWSQEITGFLDTEHNVGESDSPILRRTYQWNGYPLWDRSSGAFCGGHRSSCGGGNIARKWVVRDTRRPRVGLTTCKVAEEPPADQGQSWFKISCVPELRYPHPKATLDNGRKDHRDLRTWEFKWTTCEGVTEHHLWVKHPMSEQPAIDETEIRGTSYVDSDNEYIFNERLSGWRWRVRAKTDGEWGSWSEERTFDVEPLNTDPPQ
jgi:hypothetical protein